MPAAAGGLPALGWEATVAGTVTGARAGAGTTTARVPVTGTSVPRVDAVEKVLGAASYVADLPGEMLAGATVRSTVPHGLLRGILLDPTFDWAGVTVVTADDIPGRNCIPLHEDDQPALVPVGGRVRHVGEAVALVAATSGRRAAAAAAHIRADIRPLPAVLTIEDSLAGHTEVADGGNVLQEWHIEHGDVDAALATADVVVEGTYRTGPAEHTYLEPQGMTARWDDDGMVHVLGSLQCPYYVHRALATLLDLPPGLVDVTQVTTGGGFGGKEDYPSTLAAHVALLARKAGRPVRIVYDRAEDIAATTKRHPSQTTHRLGLTRDGRIVAADVDVVLDAGAYVTVSPVVLLRSVLHACGPYRVPAVRVRGRAVATNHVPSGAFRGFGAPQSQFAAERQLAKAARALGVDPLTLRRINMLRPGDSTTTLGTLDESAGLPAVLDALGRSLARPPEHRGRRATGLVRRGRGIAAGFHGAGFTGDGESVLAGRGTVALTAGGTFEVLVSSTDMGQGARTVLAQIAADALGVDLALVDVPPPSTTRTFDSGPTVASRTTLVVGRIVERAAAGLRDDLRDWADDRGLDPDDLAVVAAARAAAGDPPAVTRAFTLPDNVVWDQATLTGDAYPTYAWSAVAVDVAVDQDTSEVTVERCVHVVDVGRAVHPVAVAGQVAGGTVQGLGWALLEHVVEDAGRVVNDSLSTYAVPTSLDAPEVEAVIVEVPYADGPAGGAKGVGELPLDATAAAVANAVEDAIGVPVDELPLLPEVIHRSRGERPGERR
ncbi:MAG TPA: xanthine dehydrogenase family protein molybdopterin-binding subunit [Actinomycetes bacterium]